MVGLLNLKTLVNGAEIGATRDPFDIQRFPGVINEMRGKTLDRLGRDIVSAALMFAKRDSTLEDINITYSIEGNDLHIVSEEKYSKGYLYMRGRALERGEIYRSEPENHLLKASLAVMHEKSKGGRSTIDDLAFSMIQQWRAKRKIPVGKANMMPSFSTMAGFLSIGSAYLSGIPL
jgi:hypothetical protein